MQLHDIKVIPTISWSDEDSFEWCFDGEPIQSVVAISSVGCMRNKESKKLFLDGYEQMMDRLHPTKIIFYGKIPDECKGDIVRIKSFGEEMHEALTAEF